MAFRYPMPYHIPKSFSDFKSPQRLLFIGQLNDNMKFLGIIYGSAQAPDQSVPWHRHHVDRLQDCPQRFFRSDCPEG